MNSTKIGILKKPSMNSTKIGILKKPNQLYGIELSFKAGKVFDSEIISIDKLETLRHVIIEEGAMPHLEKLMFQQCDSLEDEFIGQLSPAKRGKDYWKIARIPLDEKQAIEKSEQPGAAIVRTREQLN
ncbi:unnamed protein product [Fraxinus pennsylvanica]|uniref:Uncharacterized protein n=1 Tax=Fraxinus pennsylvanica TaxID=56036 RepID=A0AAD1ZGN9_9LAMI|nr:unnamed protein product [Fraxinus pennsylvanica]